MSWSLGQILAEDKIKTFKGIVSLLFLVKGGMIMSKIKTALAVIFVIFAAFFVIGYTSTETNTTNTEPTINISKAPDNKPVVRYYVNETYSSEKDAWMKSYALDHRTTDQEELHLFTFADGNQFEYHMLSTGAQEKGFLYTGNWTETLDESLQPTQIDDKQFVENITSLLNKYPGSYYTVAPDQNLGNILQIWIPDKNAVAGPDFSAALLKNYIDLKPNEYVYTVGIATASHVDGLNNVQMYSFKPSTHTLVRTTSYGGSLGETCTAWTDVTYTSIVKATETGEFTNDPGKLGFPKTAEFVF